MRVAIGLAIAQAIALGVLSLIQFQRALSLAASVEPQEDPLISTLNWVQILTTIVVSPIIGVLVGSARGKARAAAALAAGAVILALVTTPLIEGLVVPDPRYVVIPLGGAGPGGGFVPFIVGLGIVVAGGFSALEASLAAWVAGLGSRTP